MTENKSETISSDSIENIESDIRTDEIVQDFLANEKKEKVLNKIEQGAPGSEPVAGVVDSEVCEMAVGKIFDVISLRAGEKWKLTPDEKVMLGKATDKVLNKYLPGLFDRFPEEGGFAIAVILIVGQRFVMEEPKKKEPGINESQNNRS